MSKCHKADHGEIVELRDAYTEVVAERDRARDLAAHLEAELALVTAAYDGTLHTSRAQQADIERLRRRVGAS